MAQPKLERFKELLEELFMFDAADLDFGIYRIMNAKREEITKFLDNDLLPQVKATLAELQTGDRAGIERQLEEAIQQAKSLGVDPEATAKVKELRSQLAGHANLGALENEVFSDLYNFFRRYYKEGDFLALPRYKEGVYAIPYEGEEVKLHWANHDQYYIKTSEYFRDYSFKLADGRMVHFKLKDVDTEQDNRKVAPGKERRFILAGQNAIREIGGELTIWFTYEGDVHKRRQADLNKQAVETVLESRDAAAWHEALRKPEPTPKDNDRTLLHKRLADYTARNDFDYFIHKNLGKFLKRELDFFIKNEIVHLDDIENESAFRVEQYISRIKAIRRVAHKIIDFLAQLEDFQRTLWLKRKFVVKTEYCITLDKLPEALYPEILSNHRQIEEWVQLFSINDVEGDLTSPAFSTPLSQDFLKAHPHLVLDTAFFEDSFKKSLLKSISDIDAELDGWLIRSENMQALGLLKARFSDNVNVIYIDPPYNTDASAILYKNDYKDSSWLSLMETRLKTSRPLLRDDGIICIAIDDEEEARLILLLSTLFEKLVGVAVVRSNPAGRKTKGRLAPAHEYALFYGKSESAFPMSLDVTETRLARYPLKDELGNFAWANFIRSGSGDRREDRPTLYYPIFVTQDDRIRIPAMSWDENQREYILNEQPRTGEVAVYPIVHQNGTRIEKRWHRGFDRVTSTPSDYRIRRSPDGEVSIDFKTRIDEDALPTTWWDNNEYASANYGASELKDLFGNKPFDFAKARKLVEDCLLASGAREKDALVLDYFGGSGTTCHAVINLNRSHEGKRKYVVVEMGHHFDTVVMPRMKKAVYSKGWKNGKPTDRKGISHFVKYMTLESYEDALDNLTLHRTKPQTELLLKSSILKEDYVLRYLLKSEASPSPSLLDIDRLVNPFDYSMKISTGIVGETKDQCIDLVETFNWLLGLRVKHMDWIRGFAVVEGRNPHGQRVLVIWRNTKDKSNADLDEFFQKQGYNTKDNEYDLVYVNGDNNLENLRREDESWKVRLIEEEFKRLMFEVGEM